MTYLPLVIAIIAISLYLREYFLRRKTYGEQQKISQDTRQKSQQLLHAAELAETEVIASSKYSSQKLESEFKHHLDSLILNSEESVAACEAQLIKFIADLQKKSADFEESSRKTMENRINELFSSLEERLSDFLVITEQKTTSSIELELKAARQLIDTYKQQQLKLIDENIIAMMEQTLSIVLAKKLSLKDQIDLVYESLEKAKIEKFIS